MLVSDSSFAQALHILKELIAIPSISHPQFPEYKKAHLLDAATFISAQLTNLGFDPLNISIEDSAPFIIAEKITDQAKPTILLYAHYDVQPVDRTKWLHDPFKAEEREGRLYGRGSSDDKAGIIAIISALKTFLENKEELPNIKILIEGEEEHGSPHLPKLLKKYHSLLKADALIVLDGLYKDLHTGTLTISSRGLVNLHLRVQTLEKPVHSGIGCLAPDPAQILASLIYSLKNPKKIPGFMRGFSSPSDEERDLFRKNSLKYEEYKRDIYALENASLRGRKTDSIYEKLYEEPSLSILNMNCGQTHGGNSIQDSAECVISIRTLFDQDPKEIARVVSNYLLSRKDAKLAKIHLKILEKEARSWKGNMHATFSSLYLQSLNKIFSHTCIMPGGFTLPLLRDFQDVFPNMDIIIAGIEDPLTGAHGHNESQDLSLLRKTINTLINFLEKVRAL